MMATKKVWKDFLCLFAQDHPDFRVQELQSLVSTLGSEVRFDHRSYSNDNPYLIVQLESEETARRVLSRSLLLKSMLELWGWGKTYTELKFSIQANMSEELIEPYIRKDYTFKLIGSSFSRKCSLERQKMMYEVRTKTIPGVQESVTLRRVYKELRNTVEKKLSFLPFEGKVDFENCQHLFHIMEDYGDNPNTAPLEPLRIFFGRQIGVGQRHLINKYAVKERHFIGNTSMDAQLAFIMANQAKVSSGDLVCDPFAGTGGVLVACAHFGAHVLGSDIGWNIIHGKGYTTRAGAEKERGLDENVRANLRQYGLESRYVDMLVADAAKCMWREQELFDAILTDPPYGVREGGRKVGSKSKVLKSIPPECVEGHIPEVRTYKLSDLFVDLVGFAARFLVLGGRLVYWMPVLKTELPALELPRHPCLRTVSCSLQPLQKHVGRQLVTMEKCLSWKDYKVTDHFEEEQEKLKLRCHDNFREKYYTDRRT